MSQVRIEIIIPTYNAAMYWKTLSTGIRAQTLKPDRVVVIDSDSTDRNVEVFDRKVCHALDGKLALRPK